MSDLNDRNVLRPSDVARIFEVSVVTVGKWADSGKLPSFRTPGGQRRFHQADIDAFIAANSSRSDDNGGEAA